MIDGQRVIAVIPARGGSRGVPRKNVADLGGRPLIAWSIETSRTVDLIDRTIVSTDDDEIAEVAVMFGAEVYRRPPHLASDTALVADALRHLIRILDSEGEPGRIMVLLEPTCPFRSRYDVATCIEMLVRDDKDAVATFKQADLNPHRAWTLTGGVPSPFVAGANPWLPRQQLPEAYQLNGAVYCIRTDRLPVGEPGLLFGRTGAVVMPGERSVDINTKSDLLLAELVLTEGGSNGTD